MIDLYNNNIVFNTFHFVVIVRFEIFEFDKFQVHGRYGAIENTIYINV